MAISVLKCGLAALAVSFPFVFVLPPAPLISTALMSNIGNGLVLILLPGSELIARRASRLLALELFVASVRLVGIMVRGTRGTKSSLTIMMGESLMVGCIYKYTYIFV